jgi:hypothetical protein
MAMPSSFWGHSFAPSPAGPSRFIIALMQLPWLKPREETFLGNARVQLRPGRQLTVTSKCPLMPVQVIFEDDGSTAYVYAFEQQGDLVEPIQDAALIYEKDARRSVQLEIKWCGKRPRAAVLLDGVAQAVVAFDVHRIWCRSGYPPPAGAWSEHPREWSPQALEGF